MHKPTTILTIHKPSIPIRTLLLPSDRLLARDIHIPYILYKYYKRKKRSMEAKPSGAGEVGVLPGTACEWIQTRRIKTRVLMSEQAKGTPVLFLHGNVTSATWWEETLLALPPHFYGIAPDQRGYGDADPAAKVDARRGMGDLVEDAIALLDYLGVEAVHIAGHSLGGLVAYHMMREYPERVLSVTLAAPGSPYGFGATKDIHGTPTNPDFAGSGGGLVNAQLTDRIQARDFSIDSHFSPLNVMRRGIFRPGFISPNEKNLLLSILSTHIGNQDYPGDSGRSLHWPFLTPGVWGASNGTSPKYVGDNEKCFGRISVPVLWVRGMDDKTVADGAVTDTAYLGKMGLVPLYPGEAKCPPQPMVGQIREFLRKYSEKSGAKVYEYVFENCGHAPQLEKFDEFNAIFHQFLRGTLKN